VGILRDWSNQGRLGPDAAQKLAAFSHLIHDWNARINLTGFKSEAEIEQVLIGESLLALPHLNLAGHSILDFGSGAGIPGIVWAISEPTARITSVEIRQKKVAFQKEAARSLNLLNLEIVPGLFPDAVHGRSFDVIATRAIRFSPKLWSEAETLLSPNGRLVRFASSAAVAENGWNAVPISPITSLQIRP